MGIGFSRYNFRIKYYHIAAVMTTAGGESPRLTVTNIIIDLGILLRMCSNRIPFIIVNNNNDDDRF